MNSSSALLYKVPIKTSGAFTMFVDVNLLARHFITYLLVNSGETKRNNAINT